MGYSIFEPKYNGIEMDILDTLQSLSRYGLVKVKMIVVSPKIIIKDRFNGIVREPSSEHTGQPLPKYAGHPISIDDLPIGSYYKIVLESEVMPRDIAQLLAVNRIPFTTEV